MRLELTVKSPADPSDAAVFPSAPVEAQPGHAILHAVVRAATAFLRDADLSVSLRNLLSGIGTASRASHAYVFENVRELDGAATKAVPHAEWTATGIEVRTATSAGQLGDLVARLGQPSESLAAGVAVTTVAGELAEPWRERLHSLHVLSLAAVPIFVDRSFWGFIAVDSLEPGRRWSAIEQDALTAAAAVVGAAIDRRRMESALRAATVQARLAADIGEVVTRAGDTLQGMLEQCGNAIVRRLRPELVRIWMLSEDHTCVLACAAAGPAAVRLAEPSALPHVSAALARVAAQQGMTSWRDAIPELWPGGADACAAAGLRAGVALPLVTSGRTTGVVVMLGRELPAATRVAALGSVTDEIALAMEQHHARDAVARGEVRYRRLVEATIEGIVIHDGARVVDANPSFAALVGMSLDDVIGRNPFDFIAPEYHDRVRGHLVSNYRKSYEIEGLRGDGTRFPVELKGSDFLDRGMKLRVVAVRDITDRRAAQQAAEHLREEQQARALAERTRAQAVFLADASRILASSLDTSTTLTQLAHLAIPVLGDYCVVSTIDDGMVQRVAVVHADPDRADFLRAAVDAWPAVFPAAHPIFAALADNRPYLVADMTADRLSEIAVTAAQRRYLEALDLRSALAVPIGVAGEVMGAILLASARPGHRYEADDLALAEEFAYRAALALQSARSYHTSQSATRARDEMLAVVAHDLRNPLNTIFMGSELALEMVGDPEAPGARQLRVIRRSAELMNRLIQDLLDASRLDSGTLALEKVALAPAELLREACDMFTPLAAHGKVAFQLDVSQGLPAIHADRGRLLQVLSNLVGNALKFTPPGGRIRVAATCDDGDEAGPMVSFSVSDTGSGIPVEELPHIFVRGWQARRGDRRGIGLGLAIASGIVEAHGGRIRADSREGEGSTFTFTVPALRAEPSGANG